MGLFSKVNSANFGGNELGSLFILFEERKSLVRESQSNMKLAFTIYIFYCVDAIDL